MEEYMAPHGPAPRTTWESLPSVLLGRCLLACDEIDRLSCMATCTAFAKAMISSAPKPTLTVDLMDFEPSMATTLRLVASWDLAVAVDLLGQNNRPYSSLQPLVSYLAQEGVRLPRVTTMGCRFLMLDAYAPLGLAAIFPSLEQLQLRICQVEEGRLPLTGFSRLQRLSLDPDNSSCDGWLPQLQQLASLPSLTSLSFPPHHYPSSFLPLFASNVTELTLKYDWPLNEESSAEHDQQWRSALSHAAQCTSLRKLQVGPCTVQEVATLLRNLPHLTDLDLQHGGHERAGSTDGLASTLLQHTQLTRLSCHSLEGLQQCHADSPCSLQQLSLQHASAVLLSRLPLRSLTQPLQLQCLNLCDASGQRATVAEVHAAASNLARSAAEHVLSCRCNRDNTAEMSLDFGSAEGDDDAAGADDLLRAAVPLLPQDDTWALTIIGCTVDAQLATALQSAVGVTTLTCTDCLMHPSCWVQLARSLPHVRWLNISHPTARITAAQLMAYLCTAQTRSVAAQQYQPGEGNSWGIVLDLDGRDRDLLGMDHEDELWDDVIDDLREQLQHMGITGIIIQIV